MSDLFDPSTLAERAKEQPRFPGGPNEDPGIRLRRGYLPGKFFGGLAYVHDGVVDAIDPSTGEVLEPGEIYIVDTAVESCPVVKTIGEFALTENGLSFIPKPVL